MIIDTHAHVNFKAYRDDADEVIRKSLSQDVQMINVGSQYSTSKRAVEYAERYEKGVWAAVGIHPINLRNEDFNFDQYLALTRYGKVIAIGETGLDYHHFDPPRLAEGAYRREAGIGDNIKELKNKQKEVFERSIELANISKLPVIIHCWDAYDDLIEVLKNKKVEKGGVIHSFIGGYKTANAFIELGYKVGLNGIVTYSESYDRLIRELPMESILLETDCPYLAPKPLPRDDRNEPMNVKYIAEKIAKVKNMDIAEVEKITTENTQKLFTIQ